MFVTANNKPYTQRVLQAMSEPFGHDTEIKRYLFFFSIPSLFIDGDKKNGLISAGRSKSMVHRTGKGFTFFFFYYARGVPRNSRRLAALPNLSAEESPIDEAGRPSQHVMNIYIYI